MVQIVSKYHSPSPLMLTTYISMVQLSKCTQFLHSVFLSGKPAAVQQTSPPSKKVQALAPALRCSVCNQHSTFRTVHHVLPSHLSLVQILQLTVSAMSPQLAHRCLKSSMTKNECIIVPAPPKNLLPMVLNLLKVLSNPAHIRHLRVFSDSSLSQGPPTVRDQSNSANSSPPVIQTPPLRPHLNCHIFTQALMSILLGLSEQALNIPVLQVSPPDPLA